MCRTETPHTQLELPLHWPRIAQFLDYEWSDHCYLERELLRTIIKIFWLNYFLCWKRNYGVFVFSKRKKTFLHYLIRWWRCRSWPKATRSAVTRWTTYFCGDFLKEVYSKNIRILEDFKRNSEQTVAGSVQQTLQMFPRCTVKWVNVFLEGSGEHF